MQAETLARLAEADAALAAQIHDQSGAKPFTCSGLRAGAAEPGGGRRPAEAVVVRPEERYFVRLTGLTEPVCRALEKGLIGQTPAPWNLHGQTFRVAEVVGEAREDGWSGRASYEGLAAARVQQGMRLPRTLTLDFASPTAFKSQGMQAPLPLPGLVFGSLVERWNAFSPVLLDPELRRFAETHVAVSRYWLESRTVSGKNSALRIGGVGRVSYTVIEDEAYALAALNILADFAIFGGVGVQTTTGMGQCRRVRGWAGED